MSTLEVVNIVGSGQLATEFDLVSLSEDIGDQARYDPEMYPGMYLHADGEDGPLATVYRTGKFIIVGATSLDELHRVKEAAVELLSKTVGRELTIEWFAVQNFVCSGDVGRELELSALTIGLGMERTEYEPEQFAGLLYKPEEAECTVMLFRTGKVIVAGAASQEEAERGFAEVVDRVEALMPT
jgi:transcription initiation factor TFIID TATA-box-binding protein